MFNGNKKEVRNVIQLSKPIITEEMKQRVMEVLNSGRFIKGQQVKNFETEFANYCNVNHGVAVSSGTAAIYLALRALGIRQGDEVILPSHTFIATAEPILMVGAKPVFVDIGNDYNLNIEDVKRKITPWTKAIICVHLYGQMCNMDALQDVISEKYKHYNQKIYLIEDAAQAHGATFRYKKAGSFGGVACFSFFPSKNLTVAGDGGMVVTNDNELDTKLRALRDHGRDYSTKEGKYLSTMLGFNFRMSEIPAVVGSEQLKLLDSWNEKRRELAGLYDKLLADIPVETPIAGENQKHVYHQYVIRSKQRDELKNYLHKNGIETGIHYRIPVHLQRIFDGETVLPRTERVCGEILSLPMHPLLSEEDVEFVCKKIKEVI